MSDEKNADPLPWVSRNGFRSRVQAWHPIHGLSAYRPRPEFGTPSPATGEDKE